ncbi:MAG TPA: molybdopterin-dependent oxidoreductase [Acidobacteriaceae bacterium]|jgi:anaerobic selenocysteine-containing dehydrogenase|nr:molybdopterin-dependent oxidoreductase [Acidobacteriaceae bacterium]
MASNPDGTSSRIVHAVCSHDCPDSCRVRITVDGDGRATRIQGDPDHAVTRGFLCGKVAKYLDRVYSPDRLLYPMRRRAGVAKGPQPRGVEAQAFERIGWDEALDTIAARFHAISEEFGPESILPYSYAGTIGALNYGSMDRRFFNRAGASQLERTICSAAGGDALMHVYGVKLGTDTEHFSHARTILAWGANIHGNNIHLWPFVEEARRKGARLVVIDPYKTRTASVADWHLAIRPGTDAALALGMMHILIAENLYDADYVADCTHGFDALRERVAAYTPERVSEWTGLSVEDILQLTREYATSQPSAIRMNYGVQRAQNGGTAVRAIAMLPCLIGAWKRQGGGVQLSTSGAFQYNRRALERPDLAEASPIGRLGREVNMCQLGDALNDLDTPPVKALFVYNSNPAVVAPNQNAVLRGLRRTDLFTVVHDQFLTETAEYADMVLPATTFFEHKDFQGAYGHYYLQISKPAIAPLGEARPNVWIFSQLAQRMGFEEPCFRDTEDDMIAQALDTNSPLLEGITPERLEAEECIRLRFAQEQEPGGVFLPFSTADWFQTPSGKAEFYSETLAAMGLDPLPAFVAPSESRHAPLASRYPLELLPRKADNYMNSTFANLPGIQAMEAAHANHLEMHTEDATARGIRDGDAVEIWNGRGSILLQARVNGNVPAGVVACRLGWNKLSKDGQGVNVLTSETLTDIGRGATFYSTLVEVRKTVRDLSVLAAD